jgi:hypothetical protein
MTSNLSPIQAVYKFEAIERRVRIAFLDAYQHAYTDARTTRNADKRARYWLSKASSFMAACTPEQRAAITACTL